MTNEFISRNSPQRVGWPVAVRSKIFSAPLSRVANNNGHTPKDLALSCSNEPCAMYIQQVDSAPHLTNGMGSNSNHLCRKRGTEDVVNSDLKKPRTEEGLGVLLPEHVSGTERKVPRLFVHV